MCVIAVADVHGVALAEFFQYCLIHVSELEQLCDVGDVRREFYPQCVCGFGYVANWIVEVLGFFVSV